MKTAENRKHAAAIAAACIALAALVVLGTVIISYWNTPIAKAESRTMQAIALQEDGSAEPCTVLISGISYHYIFRNNSIRMNERNQFLIWNGFLYLLPDSCIANSNDCVSIYRSCLRAFSYYRITSTFVNAFIII